MDEREKRVSSVMEIACADCGCVVDRGVIVERCGGYPRCCCAALPVREEPDRA